MKAQGFYEKRIEQYMFMSCLGNGSFGTVMLAKHKHTKIKVAVKIIDKKNIKKTFDANNQMYAELEVMKEVSGTCPNVM